MQGKYAHMSSKCHILADRLFAEFLNWKGKNSDNLPSMCYCEMWPKFVYAIDPLKDFN